MSQLNRRYHQPLFLLLSDPRVKLETPLWISSLKENPLLNPTFEWPEVISAAMNSVVSDFNVAPIFAPRLNSITDQTILRYLEQFRIATLAYYEAAMTVTEVKILMRRKITFKGEILSTSGAKQVLNERRQRFDQYFISILHRTSYTGEEWIDEILNEELTTDKSENELCTVGEQSVTHSMIQQFLPGNAIHASNILVVRKLLELREVRVQGAHADVNREKDTYIKLKENYFLLNDFLELIMDNPRNALLSTYFPQNMLDISHKWFIMYPQRQNEVLNWRLIVVCHSAKKIYFIDPKMPRVGADYENEMWGLYSTKINEFMDPEHDYEYEVYPYQYYEALENDFDSVVYLVIIIYFLVLEMPIYFTTDQVPALRKKVAFWMLNEQLPF